MKKINTEKIIAVSGLPGLFKIIGKGAKGVIVENITDKKRTIILNNTKIFSLETIRIFVNDGEMPIDEALYKTYEYLNGQTAPHHKTTSDEEIKTLFEKIIPEYNREQVTIHNMRKLFQWYNILHQANMLEVVSDTEEQTEEVPSENTLHKDTEPITSPKAETQTETINVSDASAPEKSGQEKNSDEN